MKKIICSLTVLFLSALAAVWLTYEYQQVKIERIDSYLSLIETMPQSNAAKVAKAILLHTKKEQRFQNVYAGNIGKIEYRMRLDDTVYIFRDARYSRSNQYRSSDMELSIKDVDPDTGSYYLADFSQMVTNAGLINTSHLSGSDWYSWSTDNNWRKFQDCRFNPSFIVNQEYCERMQKEYSYDNGGIHSENYHTVDSAVMVQHNERGYHANMNIEHYEIEQSFYKDRMSVFFAWLNKHPDLQ